MAWAVFALTLALRVFFFAGFGLADDTLYYYSLETLVSTGKWDPHDWWAFPRFLYTLPHFLSMRHFGTDSEIGFILPTFVFAALCQIAVILIAKRTLGRDGALYTSLCYLACPYETLYPTMFVHDYIAAAYIWWGVYLALTEREKWGGVLFGLSFLVKPWAIFAAPSVVLGLRSRMIASAALTFGIICFIFYAMYGHPLDWMLRQGLQHEPALVSFYWATMVYPSWLFGSDHYGVTWTFGVLPWLALPGFVIAAYKWKTRAGAVILLGLLSFLVMNYLPAKFTLDGYYSYFRNVRYLTPCLPAFYLAIALLLTTLEHEARNRRHIRSPRALRAFRPMPHSQRLR